MWLVMGVSTFVPDPIKLCDKLSMAWSECNHELNIFQLCKIDCWLIMSWKQFGKNGAHSFSSKNANGSFCMLYISWSDIWSMDHRFYQQSIIIIIYIFFYFVKFPFPWHCQRSASFFSYIHTITWWLLYNSLHLHVNAIILWIIKQGCFFF